MSGVSEMKLVTPGEAARLLNVHENTLRRWCDSGVIPAFRLSARGDRRFVESDVIALRSRMACNSGSPQEMWSKHHNSANSAIDRISAISQTKESPR
jgi:excisionase family DNA binding protein